MIYKKVARIEEDLSAIGLGCWGLSGSGVWENSNDEDSIKTVHAAVDAGINFFDVAPVYGFGHAETILGKALKDEKRNSVVIGSKCGLLWDGQGNTTNCLTKESVKKEIDASLKRLQTEYIDIYQLHWPDPNTEIEETMEVMSELKKAGKIRYIGLTNFPVDLIKRAMECDIISSQQGLYNMLERNPKSYHGIPLGYETEREILPLCKKYGQAFFPYSPLMQGLLTGKFKEENNFGKEDIRSANPKLNGERFYKYFEVMKKLKTIASEIGKPLNEIALNWLIKKREVTSIISGSVRVDQIQKNVKAAEWIMAKDIEEEIEKILCSFKDE